MYEAMANQPPFNAESMEGLYKTVLEGKYPPLPIHYSKDLKKSVCSLLQTKPYLRPTCDKILQMSAV